MDRHRGEPYVLRILQPANRGPDRRERRRNLEASQVRRRNSQKSKERRWGGCLNDVRLRVDHGWVQLAQGGRRAAPAVHDRQTPPLPAEGGACVALASLSGQAANHTDDQTRVSPAGKGAPGWAHHTDTVGTFPLRCAALMEGRTVTASVICQGLRAWHCAACSCGLLASD